MVDVEGRGALLISDKNSLHQLRNGTNACDDGSTDMLADFCCGVRMCVPMGETQSLSVPQEIQRSVTSTFGGLSQSRIRLPATKLYPGIRVWPYLWFYQHSMSTARASSSFLAVMTISNNAHALAFHIFHSSTFVATASGPHLSIRPPARPSPFVGCNRSRIALPQTSVSPS